MRILIFYQYFTTPAGSWSTRYYEFARRWVSAGAQVTVVTSAYEKSDIRAEGWRDRRIIDGIEVITLNVKLATGHGFWRRVTSFLMYAAAATYYALMLPVDVIIASSGPISVGLPGLAARLVRGRPFVFEVRDLWPQGALELEVLRPGVLADIAAGLARWCYRRADAVVALSEGMRAGVRREVLDATVHVIPNASDLELFRPVREEDVAPFIVYAGSLGRMDDGGQLVELAAELRRRARMDVRIRVFGSGPERLGLAARARELMLDNLSFEDLIPKRELALLLPRARCALVVFRPGPVMDTVSPNKLFDALAAGVPVVQTTQGWIRALLAETGAGITVAGRDAVAMADAVLSFFDDPARRADASARARGTAEQLFGRDYLAHTYLEVLRKVSASAR